MCSRSDPSTVLYRTQDDSDTPPANWDAIGPQVKHIYEACFNLFLLVFVCIHSHQVVSYKSLAHLIAEIQC